MCHVVVLVYHVIQQVLIVQVVRRGIISRGIVAFCVRRTIIALKVRHLLLNVNQELIRPKELQAVYIVQNGTNNVQHVMPMAA